MPKRFTREIVAILERAEILPPVPIPYRLEMAAINMMRSPWWEWVPPASLLRGRAVTAQGVCTGDAMHGEIPWR